MIVWIAGGRTRERFHFRVRAATWALLMILVAVGPGVADEPDAPFRLIKEVRGGVAVHDVDGLWSGAAKEEGPDLAVQVTFDRPLVDLFGTRLLPHVGASINTRGDTSKVYGGVQLTWVLPRKFFFTTGLGLALHNGETDAAFADRKALGARVLFRIPLELGLAVGPHHRFVLAFDHISNAYLASENDGMDNLGLMYGYRF